MRRELWWAIILALLVVGLLIAGGFGFAYLSGARNARTADQVVRSAGVHPPAPWTETNVDPGNR